VAQKHRSSTSPWGSFVGTWQAERKPLLLKTECELGKKKCKKVASPVVVNEDPTSSIGSRENTAENQVKRPKEAKNEVSRNNTPLLVESPDQTPRENQPTPPKREKAQDTKFKTESLSKSATPQGSRPESRMAHQNVQSPLGFRPPSTISET